MTEKYIAQKNCVVPTACLDDGKFVLPRFGERVPRKGCIVVARSSVVKASGFQGEDGKERMERMLKAGTLARFHESDVDPFEPPKLPPKRGKESER